VTPRPDPAIPAFSPLKRTGPSTDDGGALPSERLASFAAKFFEGAGPTMTTMMNRPITVGVLDPLIGKIDEAAASLTKGVDSLEGDARKTFGERIDVLVNNAGGLVGRKTLADMDEAFFDRVLELIAGQTAVGTDLGLPSGVAFATPHRV